MQLQAMKTRMRINVKLQKGNGKSRCRFLHDSTFLEYEQKKRCEDEPL